MARVPYVTRELELCGINFRLLRGTLLVAQLVEALSYKSEDHGLDSRCHWNFFIDDILPVALWPRGLLSL